MAFNINTAKKVTNKFDPSTAKRVGEIQEPQVPLENSGATRSFQEGSVTPPMDERKASVIVEALRRGGSIADKALTTLMRPSESVPDMFRRKDDVVPEEKDMIKPMSWKSVVRQAVSNTPKSGAQFLEDIITPFAHPVDTAKAIGNLGLGLEQKFIPGTQGNEYIVDDLVDMFKDRYGGIENFKKTLAEDPVGAVADIATVLNPAGKAVQATGAATKLQKVSKAGKAITKASEAMEPLTAAGKTVRGAIKKVVPDGMSERLYQSAAKFHPSLPLDVRSRIAKTALNEEIMPKASDLDRLRTDIDRVQGIVDTKIDRATRAGKKIPLEDIFKNIRTLRKKQTLRVDPAKKRKVVDDLIQGIKDEAKLTGREKLTPNQAQELKQSIYKELETAYSNVSEAPISVKARKELARGIKENIEEIIPEVKQLNKNNSDRIALMNELESSLGGLSNKNLVDIGLYSKARAGRFAAGPSGMLVGLTLGLLDGSRAKARLAIIANRLKDKGIILSEDSMISKILDKTTEASLASRQAGKVSETLEGEQNGK